MIVSVLAGGVCLCRLCHVLGSGCIIVSCLIVVPSLNVKVKLCHMCVVNPGAR